MRTDRQRGTPDEAESPAVESLAVESLAVESPAAASKAGRPASWRPSLLLSVSVLSALLLLAGLFWLSLRCGQERYNRLLYAMSLTERGPDTLQIEEFCEEEFLVTYEIERQTSAEAHRDSLALTQIATNSCYAQVLGYRTLSGSFFSAAAFKSGYREAVLNGSAAFQLFGGYQVVGLTLQMDGASWLIAGVIDDGSGEDDPRIYVPASVAGGRPRSLMALLDDTQVHADYAKSALKQLGVFEGSYRYVHLAEAAAAFGQRLAVGLRGLGILALLLLLRFCISLIRRQIPFYRAQLERLYLRELLTAPANRAILAQSCFAVTASLGSLAALVALAMQILAAGLRWQDLLPEGHSWAMGSFAGKLAWLHTWHPLGQALFALLLLNLAALFALAVRKAGGGRSIDQGDEAAY